MSLMHQQQTLKESKALNQRTRDLLMMTNPQEMREAQAHQSRELMKDQ